VVEIPPRCSNNRRTTTGRHADTQNDESLTNLVSLQVIQAVLNSLRVKISGMIAYVCSAF